MSDQLLRSAYSEHQRGNLDEAARLYDEVLRADPEHVDALCLVGMLHAQRGEIMLANAAADRARSRGAAGSPAYRIGCLLQNLNRHEEARAEFDRALAANPNAFEVLVQRGISLMALQAHEAALESFDRSLVIRPREPGIWLNRGNALLFLDRPVEAIASYDRALTLNAGIAEAWENRGKALTRLERHEEALGCYEHVVALRPDDGRAWNFRGAALNVLARFADAVSNSDTVLARSPDDVAALSIRASALVGLGRSEEALADLLRVHAIDPSRRDPVLQAAKILNGLHRHSEALAIFDRNIPASELDIDALLIKGIALHELGRADQALAVYDRVLNANPDSSVALFHRGSILAEMKRDEEASADLNRLLRLDPQFAYGLSMAVHQRLSCCDWRSFEDDARRLSDAIAAERNVVPFVSLLISSDPAEQLRCAKIYVRNEHPAAASPLWDGERYRHDRIRIAYVSGDFRYHPAGKLIADVLERHDTSRFETIAISFGPDDASDVRARTKAASHEFVDAAASGARDIARAIREREIDIAIDLMGFTRGARPDIFATRPALVQASYLGYPGSMGADYMDYIIADAAVIPAERRGDYSEQIVHLPHCYLAADAVSTMASPPSRAEAGLPESGVVFACFNNSFKFNPEMFDIWMRLLRAVEGSVLWLARANPAAMRNLRTRAAESGVAPERILFAPYASRIEDHLARLSLADLFLDTRPYNAHATACDALTAGVPVITAPGASFASRVAASALNGVGMPELIAGSLAEYEALALRLATHPDLLAGIRTKLARQRATQPLFDAGRLTRDLESAYVAMWERSERGLAPEGFSVLPESPGHP